MIEKWKAIKTCPIAEVSTFGRFRYRAQKTSSGGLESLEIPIINGRIVLPIIDKNCLTIYTSLIALEVVVRAFMTENTSYKKVQFKDRDRTNLSLNNLIY